MKTRFSPKDTVPRPDERQFPLLIEHKGSKVTIVQAPNKGHVSFTACDYEAGQRQRFTRREFEVVFKQAQQLASELGGGTGDVLVLAGKERYAYERALDALAATGLTLPDVAAEAVELRKRLQGQTSPVEAVDYYAKTKPKVAPNLSVRTVVEEFIESRKREEVGRLYVRDLRNRLGALADAFQSPISHVTALDIDRYLNALPVGVRTRYNYRGTIGTLMNYAQERGYVAADFRLLRNGKKRKFSRKVVLFAPEEMAKLLAGASPDQAVPLALTAFSGVRAAEVQRLEWKHIRLDKGYIEIPASLSKTKVRRLAPITPNLRAWLVPLAQAQGPVCKFKNLANQYLKLAHKLKLTWKRNALRHSFVSYRVADINNIPQVAMASGHTVRELQTDYLEVVDKEATTEWFSIRPSRADATRATNKSGTSSVPNNIIAMPVEGTVAAPTESHLANAD